MNAVVLFIPGSQITDEEMDRLIYALPKAFTERTTGPISAYRLNDDDIASAMVTKCIQMQTKIVGESGNFENKDTLTPEDEAIVYIGTIFKDVLARPYNSTVFIHKLMEKIMNAAENPELESSKRLINALFILSQEKLNVSATILKKYNMSKEKIGTIKRVYDLVKS